MTTKSTALVRQTKDEARKSNGWEQLLLLLHPTVVNVMRADKTDWEKIDRQIVTYLTHTVAKFPWLNHLALAGVVLSESGLAHPLVPLMGLHRFLRWAIPDHYPDVASLDPTEALVTYFGDPPRICAHSAYTCYSSLQFHMQSYLKSLRPEQHQELTPFLLPVLVNTPHLIKLSIYTIRQGQTKRKEQAFAVVKDLQALVSMGRRRYKWVADLDAQVQQVVESVKNGQVTLPAIIQCKDLDNRQELTFRVWDRPSWIKTHTSNYHRPTPLSKSASNPPFLQLIGPLPETPWFLRAAEAGALGKGISDQARDYLRVCNVPPFRYAADGLLVTDKGTAKFLKCAQSAVVRTAGESKVLFYVEPLLAAAALGLFALVCLTQSGMRMGELQQVSGDQVCMKIGLFPQFSDTTEAFNESPTKLFFWQLYPKGSIERQPYAVTPYTQEALKVWMEVHHRLCGNFKEISPVQRGFAHAWRFSGKHKFVCQWKGRHLPTQGIEQCLDFLLLDHLCLDSNNKSVRITAHVLRHGLAGYLRKQGVPLEEIAGLLKQINLTVTDYYSKLSPQDLHAKLAPLLTRLGDIAEIDPATIRTAGDIVNLEREALKRYGLLRHTPGGTCSTFTPCEVQFKCASCPHYIPDPTRRDEVKEKIISHTKAIRFFGELEDYLQADVQKAHRRNWERVEKEMDVLGAIELVSLPFEGVLKEFGIDNLDEADEEWLLTLKQQPRLLEGEKKAHA